MSSIKDHIVRSSGTRLNLENIKIGLRMKAEEVLLEGCTLEFANTESPILHCYPQVPYEKDILSLMFMNEVTMYVIVGGETFAEKVDVNTLMKGKNGKVIVWLRWKRYGFKKDNYCGNELLNKLKEYDGEEK